MAKKRLVRVYLEGSYIVDGDDPDMVQHAKDALYEDIMNAAKYEELHTWISVQPAPKAKASEIAEFLLPEKEG